MNKFLKLKNVLYLVIFLLPAYLLRAKISFVPTTVLELSIYILFFVWFINKFFIEKDFKFIYRHKKIFFLIFLFFLSNFLSALFSEDLRTSFGILKGWIFDPILLFIVIIDLIEKNKKIKIGVLKTLVILGVFVSLYGIFDFYFLKNLIIKNRLDSIFTSPNYFSMLILPIIFLNLGIALTQKIYLIVLIINILALILTQSYSAFISFWILTILFILILNIDKKLKFKIIGFFLIITSIAGFYIFDTKKFYHYNEIYKINSIEARVDIWKASKGILKENFSAFGTGQGTFKYKIKEYVNSHKNEFKRPIDWLNASHPHNLYLSFLIETGIIGLIVFLFFCFNILKISINKILSSYNLIDISIFCAFLAILIYGFFDTTYFKNDFSAEFWIISALIFSSQNNKILEYVSEKNRRNKRNF